MSARQGSIPSGTSIIGIGDVPVIEAGNGSTAVGTVLLEGCLDPLKWVELHRSSIRHQVHTRGSLLVRGFPQDDDTFRRIVDLLAGTTMEYTERSTPRTAMGGNIYTSTEYPPDTVIPLHNENSYSHRWPSTLYFFSTVAAAAGGATPLADSRAVYDALSPTIRDLFEGGVTYTRTFRAELGLSWQDSFQTNDRAVVEGYCRKNGYEFEWMQGDLRTAHRRPACLDVDGRRAWFNQANLFHVSSLDPDVREAIIDMYSAEGAPRNAYLGDGGEIPDEVIAEINATYERVSVAMPWTAGDLMIVDNEKVAHGRQQYEGERRVLVAMSEQSRIGEDEEPPRVRP